MRVACSGSAGEINVFEILRSLSRRGGLHHAGHVDGTVDLSIRADLVFGGASVYTAVMMKLLVQPDWQDAMVKAAPPAPG